MVSELRGTADDGARRPSAVTGLALWLAVVFGGCGSQDHEAKRLEMYRQDSTYCSKYATKREEGSFEERMKALTNPNGQRATWHVTWLSDAEGAP